MKKALHTLLALLVLASAAGVATAQVPQQKCPTCGKPYSECPYKFEHPKKTTSTSNKGKQQTTPKKNSNSGKVTSGNQKSKNASGQKDNRNGNGNDARNVTKSKPVNAQTSKPVEQPAKKPEPEKVFKSVDQMPQFPGGDAGLMDYLSTHIQYPGMAAENRIQGKVIVQFVVEKDGSVGEVKVVRSVDMELDREAVRVVKSLPNFTPGRMNGQVVRVWYTLPITFKLRETAKVQSGH